MLEFLLSDEFLAVVNPLLNLPSGPVLLPLLIPAEHLSDHLIQLLLPLKTLILLQNRLQQLLLLLLPHRIHLNLLIDLGDNLIQIRVKSLHALKQSQFNHQVLELDSQFA